MEIRLVKTIRTDRLLIKDMSVHYSQPKGFVGRNICYRIVCNGIRYGSIVGGSATLHLPGRHEYLGTDKSKLNNIVNNIFFHVEKVNNRYPIRHFVSDCLKTFRKQIVKDWKIKYLDDVIAFESLVELPRSGSCYKHDGWILVGQTKGFTCKRTAGTGTDSWGGKRVWNKNTSELRPKHVFVRNV